MSEEQLMKEIINPPKGWCPAEMYEGNNLCLKCAKYNTVHDHGTTTRRGYYKEGKYYENGKEYNTCSGFPIWKDRVKLECVNFKNIT